jgi:hypothetical protein
MKRAALAAAVLVASCTPAEKTVPPVPGPTLPLSPRAFGAMIPVIAPGGERSLLDGLSLGAVGTDLQLDVMTDGRAATLLREALGDAPPVIVVVATLPAVVDAVIEARSDIEAARVPVFILGADLYSERALHRYLFQTSVPRTWQARALARYLVADRGHEQVISWDEYAAAALQEEGVRPVRPGGPAEAALAVVRITSAAGSADRQALSSEALLVSDGLPPGTVTCHPYTWAGWADMIPRVHRFRERFVAHFGREPAGFEQEGYDAVRAVSEALDRTGGQGGDALVRALEGFRDETYSSLPIRLGPDDHVLAEESQLGLFAVAGPDEQPWPGEALAETPWRPVMRTFTTDGQKVNLLDADKRVFFPGWRRQKPSPRYWKSRFGIVTRPDEDPLH